MSQVKIDKTLRGKVTFDDLSELLSGKSLDTDIYLLKEDLLQVSYGSGYLLDVGWYPEFKLSGEFSIFVIKNEDWEHPEARVFAKEKKSLMLILRALDGMLERQVGL